MLEAIANYRLTILGDAAKHLVANFDTLIVFLGSDRRDLPIGHHALKAYISQRKHKRLFALLECEVGVVHFEGARKGYRTQDEKIRGYNGAMLYEEWIASEIDYSKLGFKLT